MADFKIHNWNDIKGCVIKSTLIIGNGASIAVSNKLNYSSLKEHAETKGLMKNGVKALFDFYNSTSDFELILRLVWQATNVNEALKISDTKTKETYLHIRDCLIQTVRDIHPTYQDVEDQLPIIYEFAKQFETIISLNYDLILYWTMMYGNTQDDKHKFKDCFNRSCFSDDWGKYRKPIRDESKCTLIFYPHGNLILARDKIEQEQKIIINDQDNLLEEILNKWKNGEYIPLFVCEGTQEQKRNSIRNSFYLSTISRNILPTLYRLYNQSSYKSSLVIYGWNMGEQDEHILQSLLFYPKQIFISVFNNDQTYCHKVEHFITEHYKKLRQSKPEIIFFDSQSEGCWNNP